MLRLGAEGLNMEEKYYVLHKNDEFGKTAKGNDRGRELYDKIKPFSSLDAASEFALTVLNERPMLIQKALTCEDANKIKNKSKPYVVAAYFENKYHDYSYFGSGESISSHEIVRSTLKQLESKLESIAEETPDKIYYGIELKLFSISGGEK